MHSFIAELWADWLIFPVKDEENASCEISGLISGLRFKKEKTVNLSCSRILVLRRLLKIWKISRWNDKWNVASGIIVPSNMKGPVKLELPTEIYDEITTLDVHRSWSWARGLWGACGSLYVPKAGYYFVMRFTEQHTFSQMNKLLDKARISWNTRIVHNVYELILRNQQEIVAFLSKMELTSVSLRVEDKAILRSMRDQANRMRNCDTANIKKSLKVSEEQLSLALKLQKNGMLNSLPKQLKYLAEARIENPEASLTELGSLLIPPITKSTVKYRWKRLCEFVGEIDDVLDCKS